ncbi:MAG: hypothetical protein WCK89_21170 [bacterium]
MNIQRRTTNTERRLLRAFTVKAHWGLLIRSGLKTVENRGFRVPPGFYLVHASSSLSFSEWCSGSVWIADRFGTAIICPSFDECRSWAGQIVCGITVVSALTASSDPWYLGDVAWELERPVPCARGVAAKGFVGVWPVSDEVESRYREGFRSLLRGQKVRV